MWDNKRYHKVMSTLWILFWETMAWQWSYHFDQKPLLFHRECLPSGWTNECWQNSEKADWKFHRLWALLALFNLAIRRTVLEWPSQNKVQAFQVLSWCMPNWYICAFFMQVHKQGKCDYPVGHPCQHAPQLCSQSQTLAPGAKIWEDRACSYIISQLVSGRAYD